jgi:uncharacterized protein YecT (DUF1311 family)
MKPIALHFFILCLTTCFSLKSQAASFDCVATNITREIDRFICNNESISALDELMGNIYQENYRQLSPSNRVQYLNSQRQWLNYWPQACLRSYDPDSRHYQSEHFAQCATYEYERRIQELPIRLMRQNWKVFSVGRYSLTRAQANAVPEWVQQVQHQLTYSQIDTEGLVKEDQVHAKQVNQWIISRYKKLGLTHRTALNENDMDSFLWMKLENPSPDLMSLKSIYYFNGFGAHGNSVVSHSHWSLSKGREVMPSDILQGVWQNEVALEVYRRLQERLPDMILVKSAEEVRPSIEKIDTWNFYQEGLSFTFSPYEVAAYAAGSPEVLIPWIVLSSYLTDDAKSKIPLLHSKF